MYATKKTRNSRKPDFGKVLKSKRQELLSQLKEWRRGVRAEAETDDEGGQASWAQMEHLAFATLEQGQRTLSEVEAALNRMDRGTYGVCEGCGEPIPEARLRALPWARFCIRCTERHQRN
jgi:RNA polymerase-binding transcription factor